MTQRSDMAYVKTTGFHALWRTDLHIWMPYLQITGVVIMAFAIILAVVGLLSVEKSDDGC